MSDPATNAASAALDEAPKTYQHAVLVLAAAHAAAPEHPDVYHVPDPQQRVVRLMEVSAAFPEGSVDRAAASGGIERIVPVFPMGATREFPFRSEVAQVTPDEWARLRHGALKLNRDWGDLNRAERVFLP